MEIVTERQLKDYFGVCGKTIGRWIESGELPPPLRVSSKKFWYSHDLVNHLNAINNRYGIPAGTNELGMGGRKNV